MSRLHEKLVDREITIGPSDRAFGITISIALFVLLIISKNLILALISVSLFSIAISKPDLLRPLNIMWSRLGLILSMIVTPILMLVIYTTIFIPFSILFFKLPNKNKNLKFSNQKSYWVKKEKSQVSYPMSNQF